MNNIKERIKQKIQNIESLHSIELDLYDSIINIIRDDLGKSVEEGVDMEPYLFDVVFNGMDLESFWNRFIDK